MLVQLWLRMPGASIDGFCPAVPLCRLPLCIPACPPFPAVPAIPLTMTAGAIFGVVPGTVIVSIAATAACTVAFLIARYVARDKVAQVRCHSALCYLHLCR